MLRSARRILLSLWWKWHQTGVRILLWLPSAVGAAVVMNCIQVLKVIVKEWLSDWEPSRSCVWVVASLISAAMFHVYSNKSTSLLDLGMSQLLRVQGTVSARKCQKQQAIVAFGRALCCTLGICILPCRHYDLSRWLWAGSPSFKETVKH